PYYAALSRGTPPRELGLGTGEAAYLQCLDPHERTGGGTVVFAVRPIAESRDDAYPRSDDG
ncbi:MAG: TIGR04076 family protein, partial [Candidatus Bipolaricaulia bacterium]